MILFFNDTFLETEYLNSEEGNFNSSFDSLINIFEEIKDKKLQYSEVSIILKCCKSALNIFFSELNKKDLEVLFLNSIQKTNVKYWDEKGKVQDSDYNYYFYDTLVDSPSSESINNSTLAEAAEVLKRGDKCILAINLPDLKFSKQNQLYVNIISRVALFLFVAQTTKKG